MTPARFLTLVALAAGCDGALPGVCEDGSCGVQVSARRIVQTSVNRRLDLLFVVDDTSAMTGHTGAVATGMAEMARSLRDAEPEISLHIGVVRAGTCDATTRGAACGVAAPEQFLRSEWCNAVTNFNYGGGLDDALACLADLGTTDCGPAQPLAAAVQALVEPPRPGWEGFLRKDAYLFVVFITATDDASGPPGAPLPVHPFVTALKALKPDSGQILVASIGPGNCAAGEVPGPRLIEFVNEFGANGLALGLCSDHLAVVLDRIVYTNYEGLAPPCFKYVRDTDLDTPGVQARCTVEHAELAPDHSIVRAPIFSCDESAPPCWYLVPSTGGICTGYLFSIVQTADWCDAAASNNTVECLACADANDPACAPQP